MTSSDARQRAVIHTDRAGTKLWLSRDAKSARLVIQSPDGSHKLVELDGHGAYEVSRCLSAHVEGRPLGIDQFERLPDGRINNCALACGDDESDCQVCGGRCPDRERAA